MKPIFILSFLFGAAVLAEPVQLIAHRGASHAAPENTLAAFRLAWEEGADGIEGDFHLSSDGVVICFHDATTQRTAGVDLVVKESSWEQLSKLDVGSWKGEAYRGERIPTLSDVLDILPPDKLFFLEVKAGVEAVEPIEKILLEKQADPKRVIVISFDPDVVLAFRKRLPQFDSHWISSLRDFTRPGRAEAYKEELQSLQAGGFQFSAASAVTPDWLLGIKTSGHLLASWTVDDPEIARRMVRYGVDFITTNRPGPLRAELFSEPWNVRGSLAPENFIIQSHRGAGELSPENSVESFRLAWSLGTVPEADLRTTKDSVIVAFHDRDFRRILPDSSEETASRGVEDFTWDELSRIDIGAWKGEDHIGQRIPSLADIFRELASDPKRRIYIDIKNVDLSQLAREARAAGMAERLILASTKYDLIREWKALAPLSSTLHWMGGSEQELRKRLSELTEEKFYAIDQLQIHVRPSADGWESFSPSSDFLRETGAALRQHGILFQVLPWGGKDPEIYTRLLDLGVASFATDHPDVVSRVVLEYYRTAR